MSEVWLPVRGYEGTYSVSDFGRIRRDAGGCGAVPGRILKLWRRPDGYVSINLTKGCVKTPVLVHRVAAEAFLGPSQGKDVNHRDCVRSNNHVSNLEWVTPKENSQHALANGRLAIRRGADNPRTRLSDDAVRAIRKSTGTQASVGLLFGVHPSVIGKIRAGVARPYVQAVSE